MAILVEEFNKNQPDADVRIGFCFQFSKTGIWIITFNLYKI